MDIVQVLVTVIGGLIGLLSYNIVKRKSAEAIVSNLQTKQQENKIDQQIAQNQGQVQVEQQKQQEVAQQVKEQENAPQTPQQTADFFNSKLKP